MAVCSTAAALCPRTHHVVRRCTTSLRQYQWESVRWPWPPDFTHKLSPFPVLRSRFWYTKSWITAGSTEVKHGNFHVAVYWSPSPYLFNLVSTSPTFFANVALATSPKSLMALAMVLGLCLKCNLFQAWRPWLYSTAQMTDMASRPLLTTVHARFTSISSVLRCQSSLLPSRPDGSLESEGALVPTRKRCSSSEGCHKPLELFGCDLSHAL